MNVNFRPITNLLLSPAFLIAVVFPYCIQAQGTTKRHTICVADFSNRSGKLVDDFSSSSTEILTVLLAGSGKFRVVEREKMLAVLNEQALSQTTLMDDTASAVRVGKMLGADLIFTGSLLSYEVKGTQFSGYGIQTVSYTYTMKLSVKVIATNTGEIIYGKIISETMNGRDTSTARSFNTGSEHELLENALSKASGEFLEAYSAITLPDAVSAGAILVAYNSNPPGADVIIDGALVGTTPLKYSTGEGVHKLQIQLAGYEPWGNQIRVKAGTKIQATLKKIKEKDGDFHLIIEERKR